jgi:deazaflavin-dependent oxidoreductase (nitroreductase family)
VGVFQMVLDRLTMQTIYPRQNWARQVFQSPFVLWRLGLGPFIGRVILVLSATGRRSGLTRRAALEYHKMNGKKYAVSAFGTKSAWYRNILADPHVTIQSADGSERMTARRVTDDEEILDVFQVFMRRDPPITRWYLHSLGIQPDNKSILANKERIHLLRFDPTSEATPPGLDVDLAWIWPLALLWVVLFWPRRRRR